MLLPKLKEGKHRIINLSRLFSVLFINLQLLASLGLLLSHLYLYVIHGLLFLFSPHTSPKQFVNDKLKGKGIDPGSWL